jgi:cytochrome c553
VERGRRIFDGSDRIASGAPACIACHSVSGLGGFGGGRLGPDLTAAYARLEGRKPLAAWLSAPPLPTMAPVFKAAPLSSDEILSLVAYLKDCAEKGAAKPADSGAFVYLVSGVAGLVVVLLAFDHFWRNRYRSVRRTMVERARAEGAVR